MDVQCETDEHCNRSAGGTCNTAPSGNSWCTYLDAECESGRRWSDLDVGDGLSGECVTATTRLENIELSTGVLTPAFDPAVLEYTTALPLSASSVVVTATAEASDAVTIDINGNATGSGQPSPPVALSLGPDEIVIDVSDGTATTTYRVATNRGAGTSQSAYLKAATTSNEGWFGSSVAADGDTVVVGAPGIDSGRAYVFVRNGAGWSEQEVLQPIGGEPGDFFGKAVDIDGDLIVVGATGEDGAGTGVGADHTDNSEGASGAVYVFERQGGSWTQTAYIKAPNTDAGDEFGTSVSLSGVWLAVGAPAESSSATGVDGIQSDNSASFSGAAYVYQTSGENWSFHSYIKASNTDANDRFAYSVDISGDTLAVGAILEASSATGVNGNESDNGSGGSGAAYIFTRNGAEWSQQAYLKASNTDSGDGFAASLSLTDAGDTLVVGSPNEASDATNINGDETSDSMPASGAAYMFTRSQGVWAQHAYVKASNTDESDRFGAAVSIAGDLLVIGAWAEDGSSTGVGGDESDNSMNASGAAYVLVETEDGWEQVAYLKASNTESGDVFGQYCAASDSMVVVSSWTEDSAATGIDGDENDNSAEESGAAYVFD